MFDFLLSPAKAQVGLEHLATIQAAAENPDALDAMLSESSEFEMLSIYAYFCEALRPTRKPDSQIVALPLRGHRDELLARLNRFSSGTDLWEAILMREDQPPIDFYLAPLLVPVEALLNAPLKPLRAIINDISRERVQPRARINYARHQATFDSLSDHCALPELSDGRAYVALAAIDTEWYMTTPQDAVTLNGIRQGLMTPEILDWTAFQGPASACTEAATAHILRWLDSVSAQQVHLDQQKNRDLTLYAIDGDGRQSILPLGRRLSALLRRTLDDDVDAHFAATTG